MNTIEINEDYKILTEYDLVNFINENADFWKMVDYIDWYNLTNFGKNDNYHDYMDKAKLKLNKFIEIKYRKEKLNRLSGKYNIINKNNLLENYKNIYKILLKSTYDIFKDEFLSGKLNVSDDSYWDLRSSIIGYGKDFLLKALKDKNLVIDIALNRNFRENFGYIFFNERICNKKSKMVKKCS